MRKLSVYALTAAAVCMTVGMVPANAYASTLTGGIPGGNVLVIRGNGANCSEVVPGFSVPSVNLPSGLCPETLKPELPEYGTALPIPQEPEMDENFQDQGQSQDAFVNEVVRLVNEERQKSGLPSLKVSEQAAKAAGVRANELEHSFSHTRPDGSSFSTALSQAGASYRGAGENIAYGQRTPEAVMESWMNSAGHRANILNPKYTSIGVGHVKNSDGIHYWTQLFVEE